MAVRKVEARLFHRGYSTERTDLSAPTIRAALSRLEAAGIVREVTGGHRDRLCVYTEYVDMLGAHTEPPTPHLGHSLDRPPEAEGEAVWDGGVTGESEREPDGRGARSSRAARPGDGARRGTTGSQPLAARALSSQNSL